MWTTRGAPGRHRADGRARALGSACRQEHEQQGLITEAQRLPGTKTVSACGDRRAADTERLDDETREQAPTAVARTVRGARGRGGADAAL
eukprot:792973-Prymnesium_polylepis.1